MSSHQYCPHCGHIARSDAKFCTNCGKALQSANTFPLPSSPTQPKQPTRRFRLPVFMFGMGASIVVLLVFLALGWRPTSFGLSFGIVNVGLEPAAPRVPEATPADFQPPPATTPLPVDNDGFMFEGDTPPFEGDTSFLTNTCPTVSGMIWLQFPDTWYGPFAGGDAVSFSSAGGFTVWDADQLNAFGGYGVVIPYPDPFLQIPRNQWVPLQQSRFSVCVDGLGNVFAIVQ